MSLPRTIKVCVLGAARQGKSALILRFISDTFLRDYDPTIEDTFTQVIAVEDEEIELRILDTAGADEFSSLQDTWIAESELFVLIFAVDSKKESSMDEPSPYQECHRYAHKIKEIKSKVCKDHVTTPPMVVMATKHNDPDIVAQEWTQDCKQIEQDFGCSYLQCNARTNSKEEILTLWQRIAGVYLRHLEQNQPDDDEDALNSDDSSKLCSCCRPRAIHSSFEIGGGRPRTRYKYSLADSKTYGPEMEEHAAVRHEAEDGMRKSIDFTTNNQQQQPKMHAAAQPSISEFGGLSGVELAVTVLGIDHDTPKDMKFDHLEHDDDDKKSEESELSFSPQPNEELQTYQTAIRFESAPKRRIKRFEANKYLTLYEVHPDQVPRDVVFAPILTHKNWRVRRAFHWWRFLVALLCGVCLPAVLAVQSLTFLFYSERSQAFCWYRNTYEFDNIHHSILLDFLGIVVGRKSNQDPEIKKDGKWFARQSWLQKVARVVLTACVCGVYGVCAFNLYVVYESTPLRVSLMETFGPICLLAVLWILLSLWIAYDSHIKPKPPPLSKLKKAELYFGESYNRKTTAYKFIRGYMSSATGWKLSRCNIFLLLLLGAFYASIPGLTRVTVGDASDGLEKKRFMTRRELPVELGAFAVNGFLIIALMYTVEIQYSQYMEILRDWVYEVSTFLAQSEQPPAEDVHGFDELELQRRSSHSADDVPAAFMAEFSKSKSTLRRSQSYFDECAFVSLLRRCNVAAWLEIRTFLACESRLFFGEQELPILWVLVISGGLNIFILYRVFLVEGRAIQSVLFNGMVVLQLICLCALVRIKNAASHFELLQLRQETLIEVQQWMMQCQSINDDDEEEEDDGD
eukprot:CAMPEP_0202699464 /NCGR_PEP_ID=MMETSP1385-20130828/12690_1 /ASSEMBLY_ACC=CAM_ASM_000861 /TAXON_ID=933848 /ORGANISM="Elphidium margaritaceum" /LENGTH=855 /DNA_ID=CAMNT_0049356421 /DNA_START=468 /DNA_END=3032 /DNA_ORIENTATION=+